MNERIAGAIGKIEFAQSLSPNFAQAEIGTHLGGADLGIAPGADNTPAAPKNTPSPL